MINAKDLRIGNIIIMPSGDIGKVGYEVIRALIVLDDKPKYEPISLTEEILLKCGFECIEKDNSGGDYRHRNYKWFQFFFNSKSILKYGAFTQLIHLHQLQNLYFALTGKELDIDL